MNLHQQLKSCLDNKNVKEINPDIKIFDILIVYYCFDLDSIKRVNIYNNGILVISFIS